MMFKRKRGFELRMFAYMMTILIYELNGLMSGTSGIKQITSDLRNRNP